MIRVMTAIDLLPTLGPLTTDKAARWVAALLAEAEALRAYQDDVFLKSDDPAEVMRCERALAAWRAWAEPARRFLRHVEAAEGVDVAEVGRWDEFVTEVRHLRACADVPADKRARARMQAKGEEGYGPEEMREIHRQCKEAAAAKERSRRAETPASALTGSAA